MLTVGNSRSDPSRSQCRRNYNFHHYCCSFICLCIYELFLHYHSLSYVSDGPDIPVLYLHGPYSFLPNLAALREITFLQNQRLICDSILIQQVQLLNAVVQFWKLWLVLIIHLLVNCHWNAKILLWTPVFQRLIAGRYTGLGEKEHMYLICGYVVNVSIYF